MKDTSSVFRELASVIETVEADETVTTELDITSVTPVGGDLLAETGVSAEIQVRIPGISFEGVDNGIEISPGDVEVADDGSLRASFIVTAEGDREQTTALEETTPAADDEAAELDNGESEREPDSEPESNGGVAETSPPERDSNHDEDGNRVTQPVYRDPDRLREVYETCNTFAEMTDALDVDVTPQTVRRYTIKHGIHEPSPKNKTADSLLNNSPDSIPSPKGTGDDADSDVSDSPDSPGSSEVDDASGEIREATENAAGSRPEEASEVANEAKGADTAETGAASETESATEVEAVGDGGVPTESLDENREPADLNLADIDERTIAEGVDLPDHLTLTEIQEVVRTSKTLYEAQRELSLDRDEARQLLQDLNLLELVHGRLSERSLEEQSIDEINRRIRSTIAD